MHCQLWVVMLSQVQSEIISISDDLISLLVFSLGGKQLQEVINEGLQLLQNNSQLEQQIKNRSEELHARFEQFKKIEEEKIIKQKQLEELRRREEEDRLKQLEEQRKRDEQEKQSQLNEQMRREEAEKQRLKQLQEQRRREDENFRKNVDPYKIKKYIQDLKVTDLKQLKVQKQLTDTLKRSNYGQQITILEREVQEISKNTQVSKSFQTYQIAKCEQKQLQILKESNQVRYPTPIYHMKQKIEASNQEVLFHVISESLRRDQNRELLIIPQSQKTGLDSILFQGSDDQKCLKFRTTEVDYDEINNDLQKKEQFILDFKLKVSQNLNIPFEEIEILDFVKGSGIVHFTTKTKAQLNDLELKALETHCRGKIEVYNYFGCGNNGENKLVGLSTDDLTPQYNMEWGVNFQEKEVRGPKSHRYDYYFPRGCYGYALNVLNKYGPDNRWILMDGNDQEWRILYHGTKHQHMKSIVDNGFNPGQNQVHNIDICSYTNQRIGDGVYFSDHISVCAENRYASTTQIGTKKFKLIFQSRVNPKAVRQSPEMKNYRFFVVNNKVTLGRIEYYYKKFEIFISKLYVPFFYLNFENILWFQNQENNLLFIYYLKAIMENVIDNDISPEYHKQWGEDCPEKVQRGPYYHKYDYYYPKGLFGSGLNVKKYYGQNQQWLQKDGNDEEWRILFSVDLKLYVCLK